MPSVPFSVLSDRAFRSAARPAPDDVIGLLRQLYLDHAGAVRRTLLRLGVSPFYADDLLQDVFIVAHRRMATFDPQRAPQPWLLGIAVKLASSHRRRLKLRSFLGLEVVREAPCAGGPEHALEEKEASRQLRQLLEGVTPKKREVLVLFELEGLTGEEIAATLGIPLKTVWTRLARARVELSRVSRRAQLLEKGDA